MQLRSAREAPQHAFGLVERTQKTKRQSRPKKKSSECVDIGMVTALRMFDHLPHVLLFVYMMAVQLSSMLMPVPDTDIHGYPEHEIAPFLWKNLFLVCVWIMAYSYALDNLNSFWCWILSCTIICASALVQVLIPDSWWLSTTSTFIIICQSGHIACQLRAVEAWKKKDRFICLSKLAAAYAAAVYIAPHYQNFASVLAKSRQLVLLESMILSLNCIAFSFLFRPLPEYKSLSGLSSLSSVIRGLTGGPFFVKKSGLRDNPDANWKKAVLLTFLRFICEIPIMLAITVFPVICQQEFNLNFKTTSSLLYAGHIINVVLLGLVLPKLAEKIEITSVAKVMMFLLAWSFTRMRWTNQGLIDAVVTYLPIMCSSVFLNAVFTSELTLVAPGQHIGKWLLLTKVSHIVLHRVIRDVGQRLTDIDKLHLAFWPGLLVYAIATAGVFLLWLGKRKNERRVHFTVPPHTPVGTRSRVQT